MYTKLFNECLKEFLEELKEVFPEFKNKIDDVYLFNDIDNNNKYLKFFYKNAKKYSDLISTKNEMLFSEGIVLLKGIDFNYIWNANISNNTKESIWKYIQLLYSRAHIYFNEEKSKKTVRDVLNKKIDYSNLSDEEKAFASILDTIDLSNKTDTEIDTDNIEDNNDNNTNLLNSLFGNLGENFMNENFTEELMGSEIGKIAEEIAGEVNTNDIDINDLLSGITGNGTDGSDKFNNLIGNITNKVVSKLQNSNIDEEKITNEAGDIINKMSNNSNLDISGMLNSGDSDIDFSNILNMFSKKDLNNLSKFTSMVENQNNTPVKDRLKKKLKKKKEKSQEKTSDEILDEALSEI